MAVRNLKDQHQSQFVKLFEQLIGRYSRWQIWADFIVMTAIELSVAVDKVTAAERGRTYRTIAGKYTKKINRYLPRCWLKWSSDWKKIQIRTFLDRSS